ncbi:MAG: hypothetical protein QOH88_3361 [Verrucomicrobiota bacterium]|jgi:hypothetical protein
MNLESARELKQSLTASMLPQIETTLVARAAFSRAAGPMATAVEPHRTVALGVARKGKRDFQLAIRVQQRALEASREVERITRQARGEVDVRYIGRVNKRATPWHQKRQRPLLIGCSVGHFKITAGTLGCFVQPRGGGAICMLSNNHVLANENDATKGDAILQPGAIDGGRKPGAVVAKLIEFVRFRPHSRNLLDCAIAAVNEGVAVQRTKLRGLGTLKGLGDAFVGEGDSVAKVGRTTGGTRGRVTAFELDNVIVGYDIGNLRFDNQIEIEGAGNQPFSDGGDSGSLIVSADKRGVALLFAGGDQGGANGQGLTYANPLRAVLDALSVDLVFA